MDPTELHRDAVVVDAHHDLLLLVVHEHLAGRAGSFSRRWIPELRGGGVNVQVLPVFVDDDLLPESALRRTLQMVDALHVEVECNPADVALCRSAGDLDAALGEGKIALVLALEGAEALGRDLGMLRVLHKLGLRMMSLTWNRRTMLADGQVESDTGGRLTTFGVDVVRLASELGIVLDVSHLSEPGFWHLLELAPGPVIASHSNCRALYDHPRNLTDEQIEAVAATGGVVGVNLHPQILGPDHATVDGALDHLEHMVDLVGSQHVGLGPDFTAELAELYPGDDDSVTAPLPEVERSAHLPKLTAAMVERGLDEDVVRDVLGRSFLRALRAILPEA